MSTITESLNGVVAFQEVAGTSRERSVTTEAGAPQANTYDPAAQAECDSRSIYVGNVDYTVTSAALAELFAVRL